MSTTTLSSDTLEVPQPVAGTGAGLGPGASALDQLEAQIQALKQQALATQAGVDQLQNSTPSANQATTVASPGAANSTATLGAPMPTQPAQSSGSMDAGIWIGLGCLVVVVVLGLIWAFSFKVRRGLPHAPEEAQQTFMPASSRDSEFAHFSGTSLEAAAQDEWLPPTPVAAPESIHPLAQTPQPDPETQPQPQPDPEPEPISFDLEAALEASAYLPPHPENEPQPLPLGVQGDFSLPPEAANDHVPPSVSEAVASEVVRVRNLLAEKRKSRSLSRQKESFTATHAIEIPVDMLDGAMSFDAPPDVYLPLSPIADSQQDLPDAEAMETDPGQLFEAPPDVRAPARVASIQNSAIAAWEGLDLELEPEPEPELDIPTTPDFEVRLALALESEALGLWQEARELALEVMECNEPELRSHAKDILNRLIQQQEI